MGKKRPKTKLRGHICILYALKIAMMCDKQDGYALFDYSEFGARA